jgi:hypothetical protein
MAALWYNQMQSKTSIHARRWCKIASGCLIGQVGSPNNQQQRYIIQCPKNHSLRLYAPSTLPALHDVFHHDLTTEDSCKLFLGFLRSEGIKLIRIAFVDVAQHVPESFGSRYTGCITRHCLLLIRPVCFLWQVKVSWSLIGLVRRFGNYSCDSLLSSGARYGIGVTCSTPLLSLRGLAYLTD